MRFIFNQTLGEVKTCLFYLMTIDLQKFWHSRAVRLFTNQTNKRLIVYIKLIYICISVCAQNIYL